MADCGSWVGDSRPNPARDVTLSPLISTPSSVPHPKRKVTIEEIPKTMCPKKPWRSTVARKAHCLYSSYFYSPRPTIWSCATCDLTSTFSLSVADEGNGPGLSGVGFIWANVGLLEFYGSGLKYSQLHLALWFTFSPGTYWKDGNHANICWNCVFDMSG